MNILITGGNGFLGSNLAKKFLNNRHDVTILDNKKNRFSLKNNKARYINYSCSPNCEVQIINNCIWIVSIKKIKKGEELSYDYGFEFDEDDYQDHICKLKRIFYL